MPFIDTKNPHWNKLIAGNHHDIYQHPGYCQLESEVLGGNPIAWHKQIGGVDFIIPLVERVIYTNGSQEKDLVSPYGYPGIAYPENTDAEMVTTAIKSFHAESFERGFVSSFIRLHPLYNNFVLPRLTGITQHAHGPTVSINLSLPLADIRKSFAYNHKRNINRLAKEGFQVKINQWECLPDFVDLYTQTMMRKRAKKRYFFSLHYFNQLKAMLPESIILVSVVNSKGQMAAGGLFTLVNRLAQFHLGGTNELFVGLSPSKLMMDAAIEACKYRDAHTLHLGGGYGSSSADGLFRFKSGFGHQLHSFSTLRFVHRRDMYTQLLQSNSLAGKDAGAYFPEYRFLKT